MNTSTSASVTHPTTPPSSSASKSWSERWVRARRGTAVVGVTRLLQRAIGTSRGAMDVLIAMMSLRSLEGGWLGDAPADDCLAEPMERAGVDDDPVTAGPLGLVQGLVRLGQQRREN